MLYYLLFSLRAFSSSTSMKYSSTIIERVIVIPTSSKSEYKTCDFLPPLHGLLMVV